MLYRPHIRALLGGLTVTLCVMAAPGRLRAQEDAAPQVAVMDLTEKTGVEVGTGALLADLVRGELYLSRQVRLVDRANMERIMAEQRIQMSGLTDETAVGVEVGKLLGVQFVWTGSVGRLGNQYILSLQVVNVNTAQVERFTQLRKGSMDELADSIGIATGELAAGDPYRAKRTLESAQQQYAAGNYAGARELAEEALLLNPDSTEARRVRDRSEERLGDLTRAAAARDREAQARQREAEARRNAAEQHDREAVARQQEAEARRSEADTWDRATGLVRQRTYDLAVDRARVALDDGDAREALRQLDKAVEALGETELVRDMRAEARDMDHTSSQDPSHSKRKKKSRFDYMGDR